MYEESCRDFQMAIDDGTRKDWVTKSADLQGDVI
jgi:hypothetical protein